MSQQEQTDSKYDIYDELELPETLLKNWQSTIDLMAKLVNVPAGLVMRVHPREIEVLVASSNPDNVYKPNEKADLDTNLYCETVMDTQDQLLVPNALKDPKWQHNPDIPLGMISYLGFPLSWPNGKIFGTVCVLDKKENAYSSTYIELVRQFRDNVQLGLQAMYDKQQLELAQNQLIQSAKFTALGTMSSSLAHELNQPLGVIDMSSAMALDMTNNGVVDKDSLTNELNSIRDQVSRASEIIKNLREYSHDSTGVETEDIPADDLVRIIEVLSKKYVEEHQLHFSYSIDPAISTINVNKTEIEQVILNLLLNAFYATRDNPRDERDIQLTITPENKMIRFTVEDNGSGIKHEILDKIFDPFFTTKPPNQGVGLGLAISNVIVKRSGGHFKVTSKADKGTAVSFYLPQQGNKRQG